MTFQHYWTIMVKRWKLVIVCLAIVSLGALIVSKLMTPIYASSALVEITVRSTSSSADYTSLLASDQLVQTESLLAVSGPVLREVATRHPGLSVAQLLKEVSSAPKLNTQLFEVQVQDADPGQAADLANDIAATLIRQQVQMMQQSDQDAQGRIQQDLNTTLAKIDTTINQINALRGKNPGRVAVLQYQLNNLQQHYTQWQTLLAQLELSQAQSGDFLRIAQPALANPTPVRPNIPLNSGLGMLAGLFLGMLAAVLFEELDTHVHTTDDLTQLLGWSVLGTIWRANSRNKENVVNPRGREANVEAYRILRTNVGFSSIDKPLRFLMVTSTLPGEGKSTIAANLAIFMAKAGKNTLLVDADLRRPTQHGIFNMASDKMGLSNAVLAFRVSGSSAPQFVVPGSPGRHTVGVPATNGAKISLEPFIHAVGVSNLRVMPSGPLPPNPSELLDSRSMQRLLSVLANCGAEIVIFDAPPVYGLSDANILASKVDGILTVVDPLQVTKRQLIQMKTLLEQAGANVLGCVLNKQRRQRHDASSYYYYYRHNPQGNENGKSGGADETVDVTAERVDIVKAAKTVVRAAVREAKKGQ